MGELGAAHLGLSPKRSMSSVGAIRPTPVARMMRMAVVPPAIVTLISASVVSEPSAMLTTSAAILVT